MKIYIAKNPTEAHIVCELLKAEQIACEVRGEGIFGLKGELPFSDDTDPYVWLLHLDQELKALAVVEDYRKQAEQTYQDWQCPQCSEQNEGQFGACWQCGCQIGESP